MAAAQAMVSTSFGRSVENSVVYDRLNPSLPGPQTVHISAYLGKSQRPG